MDSITNFEPVLSTNLDDSDNIKIIKTPPNTYYVPWPSVIITVLGIIVVIYTLFAPNITTYTRIYIAITLVIWTIVFALILWWLYRWNFYAAAWWVLLISVVVAAVFFVVLILFGI
jgi:hypothetical protein